MSNRKENKVNWLTVLGFAAIILIPLGWSLFLVGRGIQQWNQSSDKTSTQVATSRFTDLQNVPAGLFSYGGSTSWAPIRRLVDSVISSERPEFRLRYVQPSQGPAGSSSGIQMLLDGQLSFVQTSRPLLQSEYDLAQRRGFNLEQIPVAIDALAVVVHPDMDISRVSLTQLRRIYSGEITNWKQIGGPDLEILPLSRPFSTNGTVRFFAQDVMRGEAFGKNIKFISTGTEALRQLVRSPAAIYYDSASIVVPQCNGKSLSLKQEGDEWVAPYRAPYISSDQCPQLRNRLNSRDFQTGRYPVTRYLYVVIKKNGRIEEQIGQAYANFLMTDEGQSLIERAGFVRILK